MTNDGVPDAGDADADGGGSAPRRDASGAGRTAATATAGAAHPRAASASASAAAAAAAQRAFPPSPALSTLSRNSRTSRNSRSSSSGGSSGRSGSLGGASGRRSVDDILSDANLSLGARRRRSSAGAAAPPSTAGEVRGAGSSAPPGPARSEAGAALSRADSLASSSSGASGRARNPINNPGQEERRRRLERLQRERLQQRNEQAKKKRTRGPVKLEAELEEAEREWPKHMDNLVRADRKRSKCEGGHGLGEDSSLDDRGQRQQQQQQQQQQQHQQQQEQQQVQEQKHQHEQQFRIKQQHQPLQDTELEQPELQQQQQQQLQLQRQQQQEQKHYQQHQQQQHRSKQEQKKQIQVKSSANDPANDPAEKVAADSETKEAGPTPRRSKRARSVATYNVTQLSKNNVLSSPGATAEPSPPEVTVRAEAPAPTGTTESDDPDDEEPESAASALASLRAKYLACVDGTSRDEAAGGGEEAAPSSPWDAVQVLPSVLAFANLFDPDASEAAREEGEEVERGLAAVLKSVERMKREVLERDGGARGDAALLRAIQAQAWMRMMVWSLEGDAGWELLSRAIALSEEGREAAEASAKKRKKSTKKKKKKSSKKSWEDEGRKATMSPMQSLVEDVRSLMELAPYVLPPSLDFAQWLKETLTFGFRQTVPTYATELFDHFEIDVAEPIALKRSGTDTSRQSQRSERSQRSEVSHSPVKPDGSAGGAASPGKRMKEKRHERQRAYFASLAEGEKPDDESATITGSLSTVTSTSRASRSSLREKDDEAMFKTSVSLTAASSRSANPFLKGTARGEYVGTHLGTQLSNAAALFREVKARPDPKPRAPTQYGKKLAPQSGLPVNRKGKDPPPDRREGLPLDVSRFSASLTAGSASAIARSATALVQQRATPGGVEKRLLSASPPKETPRKRPRNSASLSAPLFAVEETPSRAVVEETPAKFPRRHAHDDPRGRHATTAGRNAAVAETPRLRKRPPTRRPHAQAETPRDAIVEETPAQPPQGPARAGGGAASAVRPTALWGVGGGLGPGPSHSRSNHSTRGGRRWQEEAEHLTPTYRAAPLSFGLSPVPPGREDMASAVAQAARAAARKRKGK